MAVEQDTRLEVRCHVTDTPVRDGLTVGAWRGAVLGGVTGFVSWAACSGLNEDDCFGYGDFNAANMGVRGAIIGAALGALFGSAHGALLGEERWVTVQGVPER